LIIEKSQSTCKHNKLTNAALNRQKSLFKQYSQDLVKHLSHKILHIAKLKNERNHKMILQMAFTIRAA